MNGIEAISTADQSWATLVPAIRVASTEMEDLNEAHELSKRQSETGGSQKRKSLGVLVERSSAGRSNPAKTHRHWNAGRLANRVCRPSRSRCHPLRDQPTNPSTSHQKHQFRDACKSLSPTRVAGHFQQDQADARRGGRGSQIVLDAGDIRGLFKEVDSPTMARMSIEGHQGNRRGEMAQESLFSENWCYASAGQQGEDQKHHERALFSCDQVGVDREESNHECSPERETAESTRVLTPEEIMAFLKELPDPLRTMIELDAFTGLRRGELIGLRWQDVDSEKLVLHIRRSVVAMVEGAPKTEASLKDVPLDAQTAESLLAWRHLSPS